MNTRMRAVILGTVLLATLVLGGCGLHPTPYNARESCEGAGGAYTSGGGCLAGNE